MDPFSKGFWGKSKTTKKTLKKKLATYLRACQPPSATSGLTSRRTQREPQPEKCGKWRHVKKGYINCYLINTSKQQFNVSVKSATMKKKFQKYLLGNFHSTQSLKKKHRDFFLSLLWSQKKRSQIQFAKPVNRELLFFAVWWKIKKADFFIAL